MATLHRRSDRRIQRTRQVLRQAFLDVIVDKGFEATHVGDITERANLNHGTFYVHFADKYELLDAVMHEEFQQQLASRLPPGSR